MSAEAVTKPKRNHCLHLMASLLVVLVLQPLIPQQAVVIDVVLLVLTMLVLLGAVFAVRESTRSFVIALVLGLISTMVNLVTVLVPGVSMVVAAHLMTILFFVFTTLAVLSYVLREETVNADKLFGAGCVYLLIGMTWSFLYSLIYFFNPNAFGFVGGGDQEGELFWPTVLYFSFITLTTCGYGDIIPLSRGARTAAFLEAVIGVLYIALLVARLVGLYSSRGFIVHRDEEADE